MEYVREAWETGQVPSYSWHCESSVLAVKDKRAVCVLCVRVWGTCTTWLCTQSSAVHEWRMCQTGDCTLAGSWGADSNNKENWDWNNNNNSSNNSSSQTTCQCMQQRRVRWVVLNHPLGEVSLCPNHKEVSMVFTSLYKEQGRPSGPRPCRLL